MSRIPLPFSPIVPPVVPNVGAAKPASAVRRRRLVTPLPELGLEFVPSQGESLEVSAMLTRSLSYLMVQTGSGMRMVQGDDSGRVLVASNGGIRRELTHSDSFIMLPLDYAIMGNGEQHDYAVVIALGSTGILEAHDADLNCIGAVAASSHGPSGGVNPNCMSFTYVGKHTYLRLQDYANVNGVLYCRQFRDVPL